MSKLFIHYKTSTPSTERAWVEQRFKEKPNRLLVALGVKAARCRGLCCVNPGCMSGRGAHGTGMEPFISNHGNLRFYCYACQSCLSPFDLVMKTRGCDFKDALSFLLQLYRPLDDERDSKTLVQTSDLAVPQPKIPLPYSAALMEVHRQSVLFAQSCHEWRIRQALLLGLPDSALIRPDIGKSFVSTPSGNDGNNPLCGDLVFFNLLGGVPVAIKVRHDPAAAYAGYISRFDAEDCSFHLTPYHEQARSFRMCGAANFVCFGHDSIADNTDTVFITEGQTDSLALASALRESGFSNATSIARDSASHVLSYTDLDALSGKRIVYCEDCDSAGRANTAANVFLLKKNNCSVSILSPDQLGAKDVRELYSKLGADALMNALLNP